MAERKSDDAEKKFSKSDLALAAEYLALNILNSGDMAYAKEAIETTLMRERFRCAEIVHAHFPRSEPRAGLAVADIVRGANN
jgi:hypothetical protein